MGKHQPVPPKSDNPRHTHHRRPRPKQNPDLPRNAEIEQHSTRNPGPQSINGVDSMSSLPIPAESLTDLPPFEGLRGNIDNQILDTITKDLHFERMTPIQATTIEPLLDGKDVLGQARTGTGKTVAFLLPSIETLLKSNNELISALIISPTRELVMQIATEASKLVQRHQQIRVCTAIGGTNKATEGNRIYNGCQILVATPGRLLDHLSDEEMQFRVSKVNTLVLDEADRMLDMGFLPDIKKIIAHLPTQTKSPRQSMLFSATVPDTILQIAKSILKPSFLTISTIPEGESNTHKRVPQYLITLPEMNDLAPALVSILVQEQQLLEYRKDFKVIIFAPTAVLSDFYAHVLEALRLPTKIMTMHARMSQSKRIATTNEFRNASNAVCIATDVIARGMDFPAVTHVIQVGLPMNRESYIHRLGRTARADADGKGILVLASAEKAFLRDLKDINFLEYNHEVSTSHDLIASALSSLAEEKKGKIYQGWLGYYKAMSKYTKWNSDELVSQANYFALEGMECAEIPELEKSTVGKMGLKGVKGLRIGANRPHAGAAGGGRGGGGSRIGAKANGGSGGPWGKQAN